jgi:ribonuclease BN (tRNA processing enzyme)
MGKRLLLRPAAAAILAAFALAETTTAQIADVSPKTHTRLITLGTASGPIPRPHRAQSSNLLTVNDAHYLIDAGDGVARRLVKAGIDIRSVDTVFITHHHDDHTAGLGTLMSAAWDQNRAKPIHVFGPPGTEALVRAAVRYFNISAEIRIADGGVSVPLEQVFVGHDVGTGLIYQDANIRVRAVENSHFAFHTGADAGKYKSYSYRFDATDRVIVFMGDSGPSEAVTGLATGADVLVTQTSSFQDRMQAMIRNGRWQSMTPAEQERITQQATRNITLQDIGRMATRAKVKAVVLSHLSARADGSDDYSPWAEDVRQHFAGPVHVAMDLSEF